MEQRNYEEKKKRFYTGRASHCCCHNSSIGGNRYSHIYFILGMTKQDIARAEGVHEKVVRVAIERGLRHLEKILKKSILGKNSQTGKLRQSPIVWEIFLLLKEFPGHRRG